MYQAVAWEYYGRSSVGKYCNQKKGGDGDGGQDVAEKLLIHCIGLLEIEEP